MVSVVAVVQVGVSVVAEVSMVSMVGKSVAMVETVSVVGIAMVVEGIGIGFRGSVSSGLGISRPLANQVVAAIGESVEGTSVDGGHNRGSSGHKRVAVVAKTKVGISSRLGISGPLAVVVAKVVSEVAIGKVTMAIGKRVAVVAVVGLGISVGLSSHGSKEAKSSNGLMGKR